MMARDFLMAAGGFSYFVALLHLVMLQAGSQAYFGCCAWLARMADAGSPLPIVLALSISAVYGVFALYALSGAGAARPLPLLRPTLLVIGVIYTLPALFLAADVGRWLRAPAPLPARQVVLSFVSLLIGLLYLAGTIRGWQQLKRATAASGPAAQNLC